MTVFDLGSFKISPEEVLEEAKVGDFQLIVTTYYFLYI